MSLADYSYDETDYLLYDWFCWQQRYQPVHGNAHVALSFPLARS